MNLARGYPPARRHRSEADLDAGVHLLGETEDHGADEGRHHRAHDEDHDNLGYERERHLLHLREGLQQGDDDADCHGRADGWPGCNDHGPQGRLHNVQRVSLVHGWVIVTPGPRGTSRPSCRTATDPPEITRRAATVPVTVPSAEVTLRPTMPS